MIDLIIPMMILHPAPLIPLQTAADDCSSRLNTQVLHHGRPAMSIPGSDD